MEYQWMYDKSEYEGAMAALIGSAAFGEVMGLSDFR